MKARKKFVVTAIMLTLLLALVACENTTSATTTTAKEETTTEKSAESRKELLFIDYYLTMPEMDLRANAETPGKVDTLVAGDRVEFIQQKGEWAEFRYWKDGEERNGCTWVGAISPGIKIHLLEDEYIFRNPGNDTEMMGSIVMWREPSDPDLIILWQEDDDWLYVLSTEDCRAGYMSSSAKYEIVE